MVSEMEIRDDNVPKQAEDKEPEENKAFDYSQWEEMIAEMRED